MRRCIAHLLLPLLCFVAGVAAGVPVRISLPADDAPLSQAGPDGAPQGLAVELWRALAAQTGQEVEIRLHERGDLPGVLTFDLADVVGSLRPGQEELPGAAVVLPFQSAGASVYVDAGLAPLPGLEEWAGTIGVLGGHWMADQLVVQAPRAEVVAFDGLAQLVSAFNQQQVGAMAAEDLALGAQLLQRGLIPNLATLPAPALSAPLLAAFADAAVARVLAPDRLSPETAEAIFRTYAARFDPTQRGLDSGRLHLTPDERLWKRNHPTLRIAVPAGHAPLHDIGPTGNPSGSALIVLGEIARRAGVEFQYVAVRADALASVLAHRDADAVLIANPGQELLLQYPTTPPVLAMPMVALLSARAPLPTSAAALPEAMVAWAPVSDPQPLFLGLPGAPAVAATPAEAVEQLASGAVGAALLPFDTAVHWAATPQGAGLMPGLLLPGAPVRHVLAVRDDMPELARILTKVIASLTPAQRLALRRARFPLRVGLPELDIPSLTAADVDFIEQFPLIRYGGDNQSPPLDFLTPDGPRGLAVDYLALLAAQYGMVPVRVPGLGWRGSNEALAAGRIDLVPVIAENPERRAWATFTAPYASFPYVIVTRRDSNFVGGVGDLDGQQVAVFRGGQLHDHLVANHPLVRLVPVDTSAAGLAMLSASRVDAFVGHLASISFLIERDRLTDLRIAAPLEFGNFQTAMASRRDQPRLAAILDKALAAVPPEHHRLLRDRWVSIPPEPAVDYRLVRNVIAVAVVVLLVVVLWNLNIQRQKRALADSEARFRALVENITDLLYVIDPSGQFYEVNQNACLALGYPHEELTLLPAQRVDARFSPDQIAELIRNTEPGETVTFESAQSRRDGTTFPVEVRAVVRAVGGRARVFALARDISARRQADQTLRAAIEAAENASRAKTEFLANMSHELRTPLNAIIGFCQVMSARTERDPEDREHLAIISRSGEHLLQLINDVLEMSKIEAGRTSFQQENFELATLLNDVEDLFLLRARSKGLELTVDVGPGVPPFITTDAGKLRQILINLVGNAVKFTGQGAVRLRVSLVPPTGDQPMRLAFDVADTGPGIPSGELTRIFEPFRQAGPGRQNREGTGLGLTISHRFAQLLGGNLLVTSTHGTGTTFTLTIPLRENTTSGAADRSVAAPLPVVGIQPESARFRLLIVDDVAVNVLLLRKMLEPFGFPIRSAANGQEAVTLWQEWDPHLIWMDMRMPVMDGYEATRQIKGTRRGERTRIIALTASAFEEQRGSILAIGCDDYIRKPFKKEHILDALERHLGVQWIRGNAPPPPADRA